MINGAPVVTAPAEIDATAAEQLRVVLLDAGRRGHATVVVDMARTRFCDSAGLAVLAGAHRQALDQGGGLRLVHPAGGAVARVLSFTGLDCFIPRFGTLDEALTALPGAVIRPLRPRPPAGRRLSRQPDLPPRMVGAGSQDRLQATVTRGCLMRRRTCERRADPR